MLCTHTTHVKCEKKRDSNNTTKQYGTDSFRRNKIRRKNFNFKSQHFYIVTMSEEIRTRVQAESQSTRTRGRWSSDEEDEAGQSTVAKKKKKKENSVACIEKPEPEIVPALNVAQKSEKPDKAVVTSSISRLHNPIFDGCRSVDSYERLNYISQGTYGVVFRARDKITNEMVAIKQIKFDQTQTKQGARNI